MSTVLVSPLLTPHQVSTRTGLRLFTVVSACRSGKLTATKLDGRSGAWLIRERDVLTYLRAYHPGVALAGASPRPESTPAL